MPRYVYRCRSCSKDSEHEQKITDPPLTDCPHCAGTLFRVMQPVGISLVGAGFHKNDYPSKS